MIRSWWVTLGVVLLLPFLAGCGGKKTTRTEQIGYKGRAKLDPYLAAERFLTGMDFEVMNAPGWPDLDEASMVMIPASVLNTDASVRELEEWVTSGGHLVCLVERAESYLDDWRSPYSPAVSGEEIVPEPLDGWLKELGLTLEHGKGKTTASRLRVGGERFEVFAESNSTVRLEGHRSRPFAQAWAGEGLVTIMVDARPFRNRYIGDHQHAALLWTLADMSPYYGKIVFVRDGGRSLWDLVWRDGKPALAGLAVLTIFWLWKNMPRFGPLMADDAAGNGRRAYDHHLEALGDFHWRLDKGESMLRPLRESLLERAQRLAAAGHRDADIFEWMAGRAGITRERVERAMTHARASDPASFVRLIADLQKLHQSLP